MYVFYRYIQVYMYKEFLCYYQMELLENSIKNYLLAITTIAYFIRIYFKLFLDYKFFFFFFFVYFPGARFFIFFSLKYSNKKICIDRLHGNFQSN